MTKQADMVKDPERYKYSLLDVLSKLHQYFSGSYPEAFTPDIAADRLQWVKWRLDTWQHPTSPVERCIQALATAVWIMYGPEDDAMKESYRQALSLPKAEGPAPATTYEAMDREVVKLLEDDFPDPAINRPPMRSTRTG